MLIKLISNPLNCCLQYRRGCSG